MLELAEITRLGHYQLQRRLARGGMSEVFLAIDEQTQQTVAIKVVHRQNDFFERFRREVKALTILTHQHILPTLEYGEEGDWGYMVMPYFAHTLRDRLTTGPLSMEQAGKIFEQIASALHYAHEQGILHRDIKPSNILMDDAAHIYLADFGLAKELVEDNDLTQTGFVIGTPEYMAPELVEQPATKSSDIYALGILLYQMVTGRVPFKASSPVAVCCKHAQEDPIPPSLLNPQVTHSVERVIMKALAKKPELRFASVDEMLAAYKKAIQEPEPLPTLQLGLPQVQVRTRVLAPANTRKRRVHQTVASLVAVMFFIVIPLSLGFSLYKDNGKIPTALGANAQFVQTGTRTHPNELPEPLKMHHTTTGNSSTQVHTYTTSSNSTHGSTPTRTAGGNGRKTGRPNTGNHGHGRGNSHSHGHGH